MYRQPPCAALKVGWGYFQATAVYTKRVLAPLALLHHCVSSGGDSFLISMLVPVQELAASAPLLPVWDELEYAEGASADAAAAHGFGQFAWKAIRGRSRVQFAYVVSAQDCACRAVRAAQAKFVVRLCTLTWGL